MARSKRLFMTNIPALFPTVLLTDIVYHSLLRTELAYANNIATLSNVSFAEGKRIIGVNHSDTRTVTSVTSTSGATFTMVAGPSDNFSIWTSPSAPAAVESITVTMSSTLANIVIAALTGKGLGAVSDTAAKAGGYGDDPKVFGDTLIVPADGIGLSWVYGGNSNIITPLNGTLLANIPDGTDAFAFIKYSPGTLTPSYDTGANHYGVGLAAAWSPA